MKKEDCLLCAAERVTAWFYEDELCWVAECMVCLAPMVVARDHNFPDAATEEAMIDILKKVAAEKYGEDGYWIDTERRRIPDHWHVHARPAGEFFDPSSPLHPGR